MFGCYGQNAKSYELEGNREAWRKPTQTRGQAARQPELNYVSLIVSVLSIVPATEGQLMNYANYFSTKKW